MSDDEGRKIATRRRMHAPFESSPAPRATYSVSIWDHEDDGWMSYRSGLRLFELRRTIRELEAVGWSYVSYLVERENNG